VPATSVERFPSARAAGPGPFSTIYLAAAGEASAAMSWIRRLRCGLGGHDMMLRFEPERLSLLCQTCGEHTPGWTIGGVTRAS
jgi:hypothetical protein